MDWFLYSALLPEHFIGSVSRWHTLPPDLEPPQQTYLVLLAYLRRKFVLKMLHTPSRFGIYNFRDIWVPFFLSFLTKGLFCRLTAQLKTFTISYLFTSTDALLIGLFFSNHNVTLVPVSLRRIMWLRIKCVLWLQVRLLSSWHWTFK